MPPPAPPPSSFGGGAPEPACHRHSGREDAIETLIDMDPGGAVYRAAHTMDGAPAAALHARDNRIPDAALFAAAQALARYEIPTDGDEARDLYSGEDGVEGTGDAGAEREEPPAVTAGGAADEAKSPVSTQPKEGWQARVLRHHDKIVRAKNHAHPSPPSVAPPLVGRATTTGSMAGAAFPRSSFLCARSPRPVLGSECHAAVPPPALVAVLRNAFGARVGGSAGSTAEELLEDRAGAGMAADCERDVATLPVLLQLVLCHGVFAGPGGAPSPLPPSTAVHPSGTDGGGDRKAAFDHDDDGAMSLGSSDGASLNRAPTAANLEIILGNAARDLYQGISAGSEAARVQSLLIVALSVASGCLLDDAGGVVAQVGEGRDSAATATGGAADPGDPFATTLQVGALLSLLPPAPPIGGEDEGLDFALDSTLLRYFAAAAATYEERIEVQKANLFQGRSRTATAESSGTGVTDNSRSIALPVAESPDARNDDYKSDAASSTSLSVTALPAALDVLPAAGSASSSSIPDLVNRVLSESSSNDDRGDSISPSTVTGALNVVEQLASDSRIEREDEFAADYGGAEDDEILLRSVGDGAWGSTMDFEDDDGDESESAFASDNNMMAVEESGGAEEEDVGGHQGNGDDGNEGDDNDDDNGDNDDGDHDDDDDDGDDDNDAEELQRALAMSLAAAVGGAAGRSNSSSSSSDNGSRSDATVRNEESGVTISPMESPPHGETQHKGAELTGGKEEEEKDALKPSARPLPALPSLPPLALLPRRPGVAKAPDSAAVAAFEPSALSRFGALPVAHVLVHLLRAVLGLLQRGDDGDGDSCDDCGSCGTRPPGDGANTKPSAAGCDGGDGAGSRFFTPNKNKQSSFDNKIQGHLAVTDTREGAVSAPDPTTAFILIALLHLSSHLRNSAMSVLHDLLSDDLEDAKGRGTVADKGNNNDDNGIQIATDEENTLPEKDDPASGIASAVATERDASTSVTTAACFETKGLKRKARAAAHIASLREKTRERLVLAWADRAEFHSACCLLQMRCLRAFLGRGAEQACGAWDTVAGFRASLLATLSGFHGVAASLASRSLMMALGWSQSKAAPNPRDRFHAVSLRIESLHLWGVAIPLLYPDHLGRLELLRGMLSISLKTTAVGEATGSGETTSGTWTDAELHRLKLEIFCKRLRVSDMLDCFVAPPMISTSKIARDLTGRVPDNSLSTISLLSQVVANSSFRGNSTGFVDSNLTKFYLALCQRAVSNLILWDNLSLSSTEANDHDISGGGQGQAIVAGTGSWASSALQIKVDPAKFHFDPSKCADSISVSSSAAVSGQSQQHAVTANQRATKVWGTVLSTTHFPSKSGVHRWAVRLDKCERGHIFVGVSTARANLKTYVGGDGNGWGLIGTQALWHDRNKIRGDYGSTFRTGSVVIITLDTNVGTLSFGLWKEASAESTGGGTLSSGPFSPQSMASMTSPRRGPAPGTGSPVIEDWGIAFEGLPLDVKLYPAVGLYQRGKILGSFFSIISAGL